MNGYYRVQLETGDERLSLNIYHTMFIGKMPKILLEMGDSVTFTR